MTEVDVLAVGAHPDDVEVGCGGVLALCTGSGMRVAIADLTGGELGTRGTPELREEEARRAAELLGVPTRVNLGLPDGSVGTDPGHRNAVVDLLRTMRPRLVLAPYHLEDRHPDHAAAGRLVRDACFLGGLGRWGARSGEVEPHRPVRLHHYMLHHVFEPTYVVDVTAVWEQRTAAVAAFESQFSAGPGDRRTAIDDGGFLGLLAARAVVFGAMIGAGRGEPFSCTGPLGLDRLPDVPAGPSEQPVYRSFV
jgi:bacillithiol biosynthesis deacetylase BshB1